MWRMSNRSFDSKIRHPAATSAGRGVVETALRGTRAAESGSYMIPVGILGAVAVLGFMVAAFASIR